ncbi:MAG: 50S ribosomal protein L4 [Candidatus Yanofskybacteria bacterium CG10_big_fil_rev_8_21_14_0_10_37_15]|uniref:Large ribosomal subunit protein uL4 n=1 Tax=Candidatus Yanofskybacteria bacterium CG10_big_fil_rev_8_21_14_0_10_37_15 TaxID=1975097 RepID=A0A2H0R688_9BACT|nr:MAG: 50S ribosomal protein L4 [Candidatus Yanofskybacteria bacterium CG10_big_fil_rev_8_21_14_0_10_37_15]
MEYPLYNQKAEKIGNIDLPDQVFDLKMNEDLLHQIVVSQMSNKRQVLAHAKGRGEVRGGGKKPWKQKGTGRARHGSNRSPIWKGGGATFGPTKEKNFKKGLNRKMVRKALFVALSSKIRDKQFLMVEDIKLQNPKTKEMAGIFKNFMGLLGKRPNVLLVVPTENDNAKRASKNLQYVSVVEAKDLNPLEVMMHKNLIFTKDSVSVLEKKIKV